MARRHCSVMASPDHDVSRRGGDVGPHRHLEDQADHLLFFCHLSSACSETLLSRLLVASQPVRDLLLRAKHLFVAARTMGCSWSVMNISGRCHRGIRSVLPTAARHECVPLTFGAGVVSLQLMKGLAMSRTITHMNPPAAVHVRQRADRYGKIGRPKSEAGERTVPLPPMLVAALREHRLASPRSELGLVFPNDRDGVDQRNSIVYRGFHPAQIAAGVVDQHGGAKSRACMRCGTSTPPGASTAASMVDSNCRSRWCRRDSVTPRSR